MGYKYIKINGKTATEHRYIMEQYLGRKLSLDEHVHHINRVKNDNRIQNLMVLTNDKHGKEHAVRKRLMVECANCGKQFERVLSQIQYNQSRGSKSYCSKKCIDRTGSKGFIKPYDMEKMKLIKKEFDNGLTGYQIAKKYSFNKKTVYNYIKSCSVVVKHKTL